MSSHSNAFGPAQPVVDEWGIYDPDRAGLAAVLEKLEARWHALQSTGPVSHELTTNEDRRNNHAPKN